MGKASVRHNKSLPEILWLILEQCYAFRLLGPVAKSKDPQVSKRSCGHSLYHRNMRPGIKTQKFAFKFSSSGIFKTTNFMIMLLYLRLKTCFPHHSKNLWPFVINESIKGITRKQEKKDHVKCMCHQARRAGITNKVIFFTKKFIY